MILMFNCIEFVELVLVVNMIGVIVVLLNFWFILIEIVVLVEDCVVYVMLIEVVLVLVVIGVCNIQFLLSVIVVVGGFSQDSVFGYEDLFNEVGDVYELVDILNDLLVLIMYILGIIGCLKGVVLIYVNFIGQVMIVFYISGVNINSDVGFVGVLLFYIVGIGNMLIGLLFGLFMVIYLLGVFDLGQLFDVLEVEKVIGIFLVFVQWQVVCIEQ